MNAQRLDDTRFLRSARGIAYFTEDALLDVDGTIARGHEEIGRLYGRPPGGTPGRFDATYKPRGNPLEESQ